MLGPSQIDNDFLSGSFVFLSEISSLFFVFLTSYDTSIPWLLIHVTGVNFFCIIEKWCTWISVLDNTAVILTNRTGFSLQEEPVFYISVLIADNGSPSLTSTNTLTIHVCDCDDYGSTQTCRNKDRMLSMGFRTEVVLAILISIMLIFGK